MKQFLKIYGRIFIALLILFAAVRLIFQFNGLFGQDSYEYVKLERGLTDYFMHGAVIPYSVFPIGYALISSVFSFLFSDDVLMMQLISLLSLFVACIYMRKLLVSVFNTEKQVSLFLFLFFLLSPYVLRFGLLVMSDMLCIAVYLIFLFHVFEFMKHGKTHTLLVLSIAASCCVFIRYASVVALLIPCIFVLVQIIKQKKFVQLLIPVFVFFIISIPEYFLRNRFIFWDLGETQNSFAYFYVPQQWNISNIFKNEFHNLDGLQHYTLPNIVFAFQNLVHPAFIFIGIILLFFIRKTDFQKKELRISLSIFIFYALFAACYPYQSNRYLLFTFPLVLMFYYPAFTRLYTSCKIPQNMKYAAIVLCAGIQLFLFVYSSKTIYQLNKTEKEISETIRENYTGKNIYTFSIDGALNTYHVDYHFFDIYRNTFNSIERNSLLLFNEDAFAVQFAELNPTQNYNFIKSNYELQLVEEFNDGWKLYEIKGNFPQSPIVIGH